MRSIRLCEGRAIRGVAAEQETSRRGFWILSFLALSSLLIWTEIRSEMARLHELTLNAPPQRVAPVDPARLPVAMADRR